jgi:hypothetical protein
MNKLTLQFGSAILAVSMLMPVAALAQEVEKDSNSQTQGQPTIHPKYK